MQQVRITFTVLVLTGTAVVLAVQIWLWPLVAPSPPVARALYRAGTSAIAP